MRNATRLLVFLGVLAVGLAVVMRVGKIGGSSDEGDSAVPTGWRVPINHAPAATLDLLPRIGPRSCSADRHLPRTGWFLF